MKSMKHSLGALLLAGLCLSAAGEIKVRENGQSPTVCPPHAVTYIDSDCVVSGQSNGDGVRLQVTNSCTVTFDDLHFSSSADGFTPISISDGISVQILLKGSNSISPGQGACAIYVSTNSTLTIDSVLRAEGEPLPALRVVGRWNCAAIGGHGPCSNNGETRCDGGNVVINGGKIIAEKDPAGGWGQALGSSRGSRAGDVTINGGTLELNTPGSIAARKTTINGGSLKLAGAEGIITYKEGIQAALPSNYSQVGAIFVPRGVYIDTGYKPNQNTRVVMDVTVQGAGEYWFGCWDEDYNKGAYALGNDGEMGVYFGMGNTGGSYISESTGKGVLPGRHTVEVDSWISKFDGKKSYDRRDDKNPDLSDFQLKNNLWLFAQNRKGTLCVQESQMSIICHGCTISEGETPKRNFVPCVRTVDAVAGLYDLVEGEFYSKGAGAGLIGIFAVPLSTETERTVVRNSRGEELQCAKLDVDESVASGMKVSVTGEDYGCKDIECIGHSVFLWLSKADHQLKVIGVGGVIIYSLAWQGSDFKVSASAVASSQVMFDGTLVREGRLLGNANATAVVRVNDKDHTLDVKTDAGGRFAASLPSSATPTAAVTLRQITVGGETVPFDKTLTVPKLPSALKAEHADVVLADSDVTVVDSEVTVSGDLRLTGTSLGEACGQLDRVVNGGITVGQPSPAKESFLNGVTAPDSTRIYGIGAPIVEMDAQITGEIKRKISFGDYSRRQDLFYAYLSPRSSETIDGKEFWGASPMGGEDKDIPVVYTISKAQNFGYAFVESAFTSVRDPSELKYGRIAPENLYSVFNDSGENVVDYTAPADGFVTVSVLAPDQTFGGIAVTMDFTDRDATPGAPKWYHAFLQGWHRSPGAGALTTSSSDRQTARLPKFDRAYTAVMRKGDHMILRVLLEPNWGFQDPNVDTVIDMNVKVVFRPLGFAE